MASRSRNDRSFFTVATAAGGGADWPGADWLVSVSSGIPLILPEKSCYFKLYHAHPCLRCAGERRGFPPFSRMPSVSMPGISMILTPLIRASRFCSMAWRRSSARFARSSRIFAVLFSSSSNASVWPCSPLALLNARCRNPTLVKSPAFSAASLSFCSVRMAFRWSRSFSNSWRWLSSRCSRSLCASCKACRRRAKW